MAFVVGINLLLAARLLGILPRIELFRFRPFLVVHWWCAALILLSGIALLLAYPAKALTNPVFYLKLVALSCGLLLLVKLQRNILATAEPEHARLIGMTMVCCWVLTIFTGRFLAYTNSILLASSFY